MDEPGGHCTKRYKPKKDNYGMVSLTCRFFFLSQTHRSKEQKNGCQRLGWEVEKDVERA